MTGFQWGLILAVKGMNFDALFYARGRHFYPFCFLTFI